MGTAILFVRLDVTNLAAVSALPRSAGSLAVAALDARGDTVLGGSDAFLFLADVTALLVLVQATQLLIKAMRNKTGGNARR